jgi:hypothetical protein
MTYRFPRDTSRQWQVLWFCAHRDLLQPTALVDWVSVCVCVTLTVLCIMKNPNMIIFIVTSIIYCECVWQRIHCGCDWQQEAKVQVPLKSRRSEDWAITTERPQPAFKQTCQSKTRKLQKKSRKHHRERRVNNQQSQWKGQKSKNIHGINFYIHFILTDWPLRIFMVQHNHFASLW